MQPPLVLPATINSAIPPEREEKLPLPVNVSSGVIAVWDGADEVSLGSLRQHEVDVDSLGCEGRFCWICAVPPQAKVNVNLQYEISAPMKTVIEGL